MTPHDELRKDLIDLIESLRHNPDCNTCEGCEHLTKVKAKILRKVKPLEAENAKLNSELDSLFSNNTAEWKSAAFQKIKGLEAKITDLQAKLEERDKLLNNAIALKQVYWSDKQELQAKLEEAEKLIAKAENALDRMFELVEPKNSDENCEDCFGEWGDEEFKHEDDCKLNVAKQVLTEIRDRNKCA